MILSATILALSVLTADTTPAQRATATHTESAKSSSCVAPERTGTFRITTQKQGQTEVGLGLIVLENIDGCLEAMFITDNAGPANIDALSVSNNTLKGALRLPAGSAKLTLEFVGGKVEGSITQGRNAWTVAGRKTS